MQWINVSQATYFNLKRGWHGHLFQGRFVVEAVGREFDCSADQVIMKGQKKTKRARWPFIFIGL